MANINISLENVKQILLFLILHFFYTYSILNPMKRLSMILLILISVLNVYSQDLSTQNMIPAVSKDLPSWLQKIPAGNEMLYGFQNRDEFSRASLGTPYPVFTLSEEFFTQPNPAFFLKSSTEWRIPVTVDQENRALVTIIQNNGEWKIVDIGASVLAREIGSYEKKLSGKQSGKLKIFRVYQIQSDFLFYDDPVSMPEKIYLIPLHSACLNLDGLNVKTDKQWTLSEVSGMIRESLSVNKMNR